MRFLPSFIGLLLASIFMFYGFHPESKRIFSLMFYLKDPTLNNTTSCLSTELRLKASLKVGDICELSFPALKTGKMIIQDKNFKVIIDNDEKPNVCSSDPDCGWQVIFSDNFVRIDSTVKFGVIVGYSINFQDNPEGPKNLIYGSGIVEVLNPKNFNTSENLEKQLIDFVKKLSRV